MSKIGITLINMPFEKFDILYLGSDTKNDWTSSFHSEFYPQMAKQKNFVYMYVHISITSIEVLT